MKNLKGLCTDTRPVDTPEGYYFFGKNGMQGNIDGSTTNEQGFVKLKSKVSLTIIGVVETDSKTVIFSTNNTYSEIGVLDAEKDIYNVIVNDENLDYKFNFNLNNPIKGEFQKDYKNRLIVSWKDNINPPRIINIDNNKNKNIDDYLLFSSWQRCTIESLVSQGGSVIKGCYIPVVRYINEGLYTDYFVYGKPCYVSSTNNSEITLNITNIDKRYNKIQVAFLITNEGITKVIELTPVAVSDNVRITYSGSYESETTLELLFGITPYYTNAKAITQLNDELFLGNLEEYNLDKINYYMQKQALKAKLKWKSSLISNVISTNGDGTFISDNDYLSGKYKGLCHQETYAFYIIANLKNGRKTNGYIIANREAILDDLSSSLVGGKVGVVAKKYQIEDTIDFATVDYVNNTGDFGYWENQDETYPEQNIEGFGNPFEELKGKKVRHFRTPSHELCFSNFYNYPDINYGSKELDILSVIVEFTIPEEIKDQVVSYELCYAKRNQIDITNLGQSLFLVGSKQRNQTGVPFNVTSTGGNFNYNAYGVEDDANKANFIDDTIMRFHSFDMLQNKLAVKPDILINQLKYKKQLNFGVYNPPTPNVNYKLQNIEGIQNDSGDFNTSFYKERSIYQVIDYTNISKSPLLVSSPINNNKARKLANFKFAPNNSYFGDIDNRLLESCYTATLLGHGVEKLVEEGDATFQTFNGDETNIYFPMFEISYLSNLLRVLNNVFVNFYNQELVSTGVEIKTIISEPIYGGDMFVSDYSFVTYGRRDIYDNVSTPEGSNRFVHRFLCETASNVNLRYQKVGDIYTNFYPKSNGKWIRSLDKSLEPNSFGYDREFNLLLEENITCFNPFAEPQYTHPFRVTRSSPSQREKNKRSWRNFSPLDYYEMPKNYGDIINLESLDDKLLIHHRNALFVTREKARLTTDILSVVLGAGDIFEFNPIQALETNLGYGGTTQNNGLIVSPLGYHFIENGKPFIYKNGLKSLTNSMYNFFSKYLTEEEDNTFIGNGITYGYDKNNKRFLISVKSKKENIDTSFTLSYSIEQDNWVFYHDYIADFYFHTKNNLFSIKNNTFYKNSGGKAGVYYDEVVNPFIIDVVFRTQEEVTLESVNWITENIKNYLSENEYLDEFNTLTHISVRNLYQHTGRIELKTTNWWDKNYSKKKNKFNFNHIRNIITRTSNSFVKGVFQNYNLENVKLIDNWYNKDYMESNFFIVRFEYDNNLDSLFCLNEVGITFNNTIV